MAFESRYDRQQRFGPIGSAGQQLLANGRVLVIGVGALGSVVAELLARAGVGFLRLVDRDTVDWTNLQRQSLYTESDARAGLAKVDAASARLGEINSEIEIEAVAADVTSENLQQFASGVHLIVDGTDNFEIRFLINDVAWSLGIPWVHGGCLGASGQVFAFRPGLTICFRCLIRDTPDASSIATCDTAGVLGPATHLVASLQALEVIKLLAMGKLESNVNHRMLSADLWSGRYRNIDTRPLRSGSCPCCDAKVFEYLNGSKGAATPLILCGKNAVQIPAMGGKRELALGQFAEVWQGLGTVSQNRFLVRLTLPDERSITLFRDGRAVIAGTEDPITARTLYARFVGG